MKNIFDFRKDPSSGMDRKNLSIVFSEVRQTTIAFSLGFFWRGGGGMWSVGAGTGLVFLRSI